MKLNTISKGLRLIRMLNHDPHSKLGPLKVDIAVTSACNYRCIFCGTHSSLLKEKVKPQFMSRPILTGILDSLIELKTKDVLFAGNGEPFLSSAMFDVISNNIFGLRFEILTNGSMLDKATGDTFFPMVSKLTVSLNSGNGNSHKITHGYNGESQFGLIFQYLVNLAIRNRNKLELNYVITRDNFNEIPEFLKLARVLGVRYHIRSVDAKQFNELEINDKPQPKQLYPCYMGFIQPGIRADGSVLLCCGDFARPLGNLNNRSFKDIWQDENSRALRFKAATMHETQEPVYWGCYDCQNAVASSSRFHKIYSKVRI